MYNPDGVELEFPRQNANGIDIESNWSTIPSQPEVTALRNRFLQLMLSDAPIEVALNMHSAGDCRRYFVYHDSIGTSEAYTVLEQDFISGIQLHFPGGIEPWNYFISWRSGTPLVYPESWFWVNYREGVMALTYEDMNCPAAGDYDKTAFALLRGAVDYLGLVPTTLAHQSPRGPFRVRLAQSYPNPISLGSSGRSSATVEYELPSAQPVRLGLYDILGRRVALLDEGNRPAGISSASFHLDRLSTGTYFYRLETPSSVVVRSLLITR
jgi:hypothetical protein